MSLDLHTHTVCSDGTTTPADNVALAAAAGLRGLALTDHDTLAGWDEAAAACDRRGLVFVPGIELSTEGTGPDAGTSVHLLGYWVDPDDPALAGECARLFDERSDRAQRILARLAALGVAVDPAVVRAHAGDAPVGRPHIAQAMVDAGIVADIDSAFATYLADGGPAWVAKHALAPEDGVRLIRAAGGVAVLAHPGVPPRPPAPMTALVDRLAAVGLAGVEADHAAHAPEAAAYWRVVAAERELLVTGSSDFHGTRKDVALGASTTPWSTVDALRQRAVAPAAAGGREPW